jgi:hypothetical protein
MRQLHCLFNGVSGDSAGANNPVAIGAAIAAAQAPGADRLLLCGGECFDLVLSTDENDVGVDGLTEDGGGDLRTDTARVTQRDGDPRPLRPLLRPLCLLRPLRLLRLFPSSPYDLIST